MISPSIQIGAAANLILGLNPDWNPATGRSNILYPPKQAPITPKSIDPIEHRGSWSYPEITLHESARSLLDELIPYRVVSPPSELDAPDIGAGALLIGAPGSEASIAALSKTIGVDLANPDLRYALAKLTRTDGQETHASASSGMLIHVRPRHPDPGYRLTREFRSDSTRIRHSSRETDEDFDGTMSKETANKTIDMFGEYGTHYVSLVELGDTIVQVYAYASRPFQKIKAAYAPGTDNRLSGLGAIGFAFFTQGVKHGPFGLVQEYGNLLSLGGSETFRDSVENGDWNDAVWAKENSVFSVFNPSPALPFGDLDEKFTDQAPIRIELASLSVVIEQKRSLVWQRVFKGAMAQKFRRAIDPNFSIYDERDFVKFLPEDQPGVVSFIATPRVNLYKTRLDIGGMQFVARDELEDLVLFSNVLSADSSGPVRIPGTKVKLFAQVFDMRSAGAIKSLVLKDDALKALELGCREFLGAASVEDESGTAYHLILDGLRYGLTGSGPAATPIVEDDIRRVPPLHAIPELVNSIEFSMAFAEAVVSDQSACPNDQIQIFVREYLTWLATVIPSTADTAELIGLRVRALDLATLAGDPDVGSFVPILPYEKYKAFVNDILAYLDRIERQIDHNEDRINLRRQQELIIDVGKDLNENIVASGDLLIDVISANTAQQEDLEKFYDSLIRQKQAEAKEQQTKINELKASLQQARGQMDPAIQKYKVAVENWQKLEQIKFGLEVATNLFSIGTSIFIPASGISAVAALGETVQRIQKILNVLNATQKLYTGIDQGLKGLKGAQSALDGLDAADFQSPSTLSWDEMSAQFTEIIASGPAVFEKAALQTAFTVLVLRGKAVTLAESSLHAIEREIFASQMQKELNKAQAARLKELQERLKPKDIKHLDKSEIDLMALTGHLSFIQNQMLSILARAFVLQDLALQYEFLQPATPVTSFSLMKFSSAIVEQGLKSIQAQGLLARHQTTTTSIEFVIEDVCPDEVTGGRSFNSSIFLSAPEFFRYANTRVISVVANVDEVESTESGRYHLKLAFGGDPFNDRDIERDTLIFRTPSRERIYEYRDDGTPDFTDGGKTWSKGVSRITPFSTWMISFPDTSSNKGIKFKQDRLTIKLTFEIEARIVNPASVLQRRALRRLQLMPPGASSSTAFDMAAIRSQGQPSKEDLIKAMFAQGSCTNGWDVVFNLSLDQINRTLKSQYDGLMKDRKFENTITVDAAQSFPGVTVITRFTIIYGFPLLTFSVNNDNTANLNMAILEGSSIQKCSKIGDNPEVCTPQETIKGLTLTATIPLSKVRGGVNVEGERHDVLRIELDMLQGAFKVGNLELSDETKLEFNKAVVAHFFENPVRFLINELDLTDIGVAEPLRPSDFVFRPLRASKEMLQVFIMTGGRPALDYSRAFLKEIEEPLPIGQDASMMVRSGLMFDDVLPGSLEANGWTLAGVNPGNPAKAWTGKITAASLSADVNLSPLNTKVLLRGRMVTHTYFVPGGNTVSWPVDGAVIASLPDGQLHFSGSRKQEIKYVQKRDSTRLRCKIPPCSEKSEKMFSTGFTLDVRSTMPIDVGGSGRDQTIVIRLEGKSATFAEGRLAGGGPSNSDDLEARVNQLVQQQLPPQIASKLSINFKRISIFALKNLLFPEKNFIDFSSCSIPGDLLLLGNFLAEKAD